MKYHPRILDDLLEERLASTGAVVIEGPKASGKTATARQFATSEVLLDVDENARKAIAIDPELVLEGEVPRLIDEWQLEPTIWNHIRRTIDHRGKPGQFILTGSAVPTDDITRHTGAGRLTRIQMRPMTLFESNHSTGTVSLAQLLQGEYSGSPDPGLDVRTISELIATGGWPGHLELSVERSVRAVRSYLNEVRRVDVGKVDGKRRDPQRIGRLFRSLARNVATEAPITTLAADTGGAEGPISDRTARDYVDILDRLMIVENQPAWAPHLRSKSILRKSPRRHFVDPSLAVAALGADASNILDDLNFLGFLFESLVVRDLRVYGQANEATVYHYRDNTGLEVDTIVERTDGCWAAFEIKLGQGFVEQGAENLLKFADRVDTAKSGKPKMLGVIVGTGYGYLRDDGVAVIPIGALGP